MKKTYLQPTVGVFSIDTNDVIVMSGSIVDNNSFKDHGQGWLL